jgi:hypothetical protein
MKKILIGFLLLLGAAQLVYPFLSAAQRYAFRPVFARAFDLSKFTEEQKNAYHQFGVFASHDWYVMSCFGISTIVIAVLLAVVEGKKKPAA